MTPVPRARSQSHLSFSSGLSPSWAPSTQQTCHCKHATAQRHADRALELDLTLRLALVDDTPLGVGSHQPAGVLKYGNVSHKGTATAIAHSARLARQSTVKEILLIV